MRRHFGRILSDNPCKMTSTIHFQRPVFQLRKKGVFLSEYVGFSVDFFNMKY